MAKSRIKIPKELEFKLLYKSARTCCVCKESDRPITIHHLDENPANNVESNLIVLCKICHDEVHTTHKLSKNLTIEHLRDFKEKWEDEIEKKSSSSMLPKNNISQAIWTFINHQKLPYIMKSFGIKYDSYVFNSLKTNGYVDKNGFPITTKIIENSKSHTTIYDYIPWSESHRLHYLYSEVVDKLIVKCNPIELGAIWSKKEITYLVKPGSIIYCLRGFYFKTGEIIEGEEDRLVCARSKGIEIKFMANTRHMFGSSALYDSFVGHKFAATLLLVKNIGEEENNLTINCTPIAMGMGFLSRCYKNPRPLKYGWNKYA